MFCVDFDKNEGGRIAAPNSKMSTNKTVIEVQVISAKWCKRCHTIKPEVEEICKLNGASFEVVDYDLLDDSETTEIKSLPTILLRSSPDAEWSRYVADTLETFKKEIVAISLKNPAYEDF
jgi:thiol-disulfide isomerase/thioredoxin